MTDHTIKQELDAGHIHKVRLLMNAGSDASFAIKAAAVDLRVDLALLQSMASTCNTPFGRAQLFEATDQAIAYELPERAAALLNGLLAHHSLGSEIDVERLAGVLDKATTKGMMDVARMCVGNGLLKEKHVLGAAVEAVKAGRMDMFELLAPQAGTLPIHRLLDYSLHFGHAHMRDHFLALANDEDKLYAAAAAAAWHKWGDVLDMLRQCHTFPNQESVDLLMIKAVENGQTAIVAILPPASNAQQETLVGRAIAHNQVDMFELLLGRLNGHSKVPSLINLASSHRHWGMVLMLCQRLVSADKPPKHLIATLSKTLVAACGGRAPDDMLERLCQLCPNDALQETIGKQAKGRNMSHQLALVKAHFDRRALVAAVDIQASEQSKKPRKM